MERRIERIITACILIFAMHQLMASGLSFKIVNTSAGLPSNLVYDVAQDNSGLTWIVTGQGLCVYDGLRVVTFNESSLPGIDHIQFREVEVDCLDRIWLKDENGHVYHLDEHLVMHSFPFADHLPEALNFLTNEEGKVDVITDTGHYVFYDEDNSFQLLHAFEEAAYQSYVEVIEPAYKGKYVIPADNRVKVYDAKAGKVVFSYPLKRAEGGIFLTDTSILVTSRNFNILREVNILTGEIIHDYGEEIYSSNPGLNTYYRKLCRIDEATVGITSGYRGLFLLNLQTGEIQNFRQHPFEASSISSDNTFIITRGKADQFFVTTRTTGLNIPDMHGHSALHIQSFLDPVRNSVFEGFIGNIKIDRVGKLWMGTQQGLMRYDPNNGQAGFVELSKFDEEFQGVRELDIDATGHIWVGFSNEGIVKLEPGGKIVEVFSSRFQDHRRIPNDYIYEIQEDFDGNILFSSSNGCFVIDPVTNRVLENPGPLWENFNDKIIRFLRKQGENWLVGTSSDGAFICSRDRIIAQFNTSNGLLSNSITSICIDDRGRVFVGTWEGLTVYTPRSGFTGYEIIQHDFNTRVLSLDLDSHGKLWLALENDLYQMDPDKNTFQKYDDQNGFKGGGFRLGGSYYDKKKDILYFGTNKGVSYFNPDMLSGYKTNLNPRLFSVSFGDSIHYCSGNDLIEVPFTKNTFTIDYHHVDIWYQPEIAYEYRLNGEAWRKVRTSPLILENVPSGRMHLELRASEDGQNWVSSANSLRLEVAYPWWGTTWFYLIVAGALLFTGYRIYLILKRIREVRREKFQTEIALHHNMQKVSEIEMKALRSQMNPHFMFNSLNSINSFILNNDPENASDYLTNFAQLMRVILENSRHEWVTLENELRAIRLYIEMEELRFINKFQYTEQIDPDIQTDQIMIPPMLIQPFFENAIWHGLLPATGRTCALDCSIRKELDVLHIEIRDNGIGKNAAMRNRSKFKTSKKSFGMRIISERMDMINARYGLDAFVQVMDLSEIEEGGQGTLVVIQMKIMMKNQLETKRFEQIGASQ